MKYFKPDINHVSHINSIPDIFWTKEEGFFWYNLYNCSRSFHCVLLLFANLPIRRIEHLCDECVPQATRFPAACMSSHKKMSLSGSQSLFLHLRQKTREVRLSHLQQYLGCFFFPSLEFSMTLLPDDCTHIVSEGCTHIYTHNERAQKALQLLKSL